MEKRLVRVANAILDLERSDAIETAALPDDLLKLDSTESTVGLSSMTREAMKRFIDSPELEKRRDYDVKLAEKIACYLSLPADNIRCFGGSGQAFDNVARTYLEAGTEIVVNSPASEGITNTASSTGARVIDVWHDNPFETYIEALINSIGPKTRLVYIANPNEYSGACFTEAEIVFLLAYAERIMVVVDEKAFEFCGHSVADLITRFPNLVVIRSFSGAFGIGCAPLEYIITDSDNLSFIDRIGSDINKGLLSQVAALAALDDQSSMREYVDAVEESRKMLWQSLPESGYEFHLASANYFLLKVSDSGRAAKLLLADGILIKRLGAKEKLDGYLRITLGTPAQTDRLLLSLSKHASRLATGFNRNRIPETVDRVAVRVKEVASKGK